MTSMPTTIDFEVPRLLTEPVIASGCCAVPAEDLIKEELTAVRGVQDVTREQETGRLTYDPAQTDARAIRVALQGIGYPAGDRAYEATPRGPVTGQ